jgi:hypothetical protein
MGVSNWHWEERKVCNKEAVMQRSGGWGPGEGVLLDGFVVGVEGGFEQEYCGNAAGHLLDVANFVLGEGAAKEGSSR